MYTLENGKTIKLTDRVPTITQTVLSTKESGKKTSNMAMELKSGEMEPSTKVNTLME